jgi:hypothetical protein
LCSRVVKLIVSVQFTLTLFIVEAPVHHKYRLFQQQQTFPTPNHHPTIIGRHHSTFDLLPDLPFATHHKVISKHPL